MLISYIITVSKLPLRRIFKQRENKCCVITRSYSNFTNQFEDEEKGKDVVKPVEETFRLWKLWIVVFESWSDCREILQRRE